MVSKEKLERLSTTAIYHKDLVRLAKLKRERTNKKFSQQLMEQNADVIRRALAALEEKERSQSVGV